MSMSVLPKITLKDIGCNGAAAGALQKENEKLALARIYGVASGVKIKEDKRTGTFHTALKGNFRAKNMQEGSENFGVVFSSGLLYLPGGLQELVEGQLEQAGEDAEVTFALDVYAYKVNRQGAPYSYGGVILGEPTKEDPLSRLEAEFSAVPPLAIEAPKEVPEKGGKKNEDKAPEPASA